MVRAWSDAKDGIQDAAPIQENLVVEPDTLDRAHVSPCYLSLLYIRYLIEPATCRQAWTSFP